MNFNNFFNTFQNAQQAPYNPYDYEENYDGFYDDSYDQPQHQYFQSQYSNNMFNRRANDDWSWDPDDEEALFTGGIYQNRPNRANMNNANLNAQHQQRVPPQANKSNQQSKREPKKEEHKSNNNKSKVEKMEVEEEATNTGQYYKNIGNQYYQKGLYKQALENYTRAIEENDTESVFFSNRARCYKQLGDLNQAYEDAKVAVELDDLNVKAYLLCGQILAEIGKIEPGFEKLNRALTRIKKALDLCISQGKNEFEKDLKNNMMKVRKVIWLKKEEINKQKKIEGLNFIKELMSCDKESGDVEKTQILSEIFHIVGDPLKPTVNVVPDDLCCKITMDIMQNPVITPSGVSYEKETLVNHFKNGGYFDPVTREPLRMDQINPNKTIKKAIEGFTEVNPWLFEQKEGESFLDIKF